APMQLRDGPAQGVKSRLAGGLASPAQRRSTGAGSKRAGSRTDALAGVPAQRAAPIDQELVAGGERGIRGNGDAPDRRIVEKAMSAMSKPTPEVGGGNGSTLSPPIRWPAARTAG